MGDRIPWDAIPDQRGSLPAGLYTFELDALERQMSRNNTVMYKETKHVVDGTHKGAVVYEYHNIGTPGDPLAQDPKTWQEAIGARTLKGLFKVIDVPFGDDVSAMSANAQGRRFLQDVTEKVEPDTVLDKATGKQIPNEWTAPDGRRVSRAGMRSNNFGRRYHVGPMATAPVAAGGGSEETVKSPFTGEMVPKAQYAAHLQQHLSGSGKA